MGGQSPYRAPATPVRPSGRSRVGLPVRRAAAAAVLAGLLIGWNSPPAPAQQSPDSWSAERRAVLPSGLRVQLDFAPLPGVDVTAAPGKLAERPGATPPYTDGLRAGDPAQTFLVAEKRPRADGSWRTLGTLQISFSRAVRNPRLHVGGLAGLATGTGGATGTATRLTVTGGSPAAPTLVGRTGWSGWTVRAGELAPAGEGATDGSADGSGTLELTGSVGTVTLRVEQRSTARSGSTTAPTTLRQAYSITVDEGLGTAPQSYGNASHVITDLFLGQDAATSSSRARPGLTQTVAQPLVPGEQPPPPMPYESAPDDGPVVELDHGAGRRSPWTSTSRSSSPLPPQLQPGRGEYLGADPTLEFPNEAAAGRYYDLTVPVGPGVGPATLAGWIDFDHNGRFDPLERVQAEVPAGADSSVLEWTVPDKAAGGETWARLRIARNGAQLVTPGGFADSGEVVDQRVKIAVGAARPEISWPVPGTVTADPKPEIRGEGAVQGATVAVLDGERELCRGTAGADGAWSCRPAGALAAGAHALTPVETTKGGLVLRGTPVRITVKTAPPAPPALTLPEFTNDPGLLITGTGEAGSTVSVALTDLPGGVRAGSELCSTEVGDGGAWSCLPVENLADGPHRLTASAVDQAGNRTDGKPVALTVDTVAPDRPQLGAPAPGETLGTARPRLSGRAEPGAMVTVTTQAAGGERATVCGAVAAADSSWSCTATRDLPAGEQTLLATATDRAGNGTAGEPVRVVAPAAGTPEASPSASASASPSPSASASASVTASPSGSASPSAPVAEPTGAPSSGAPSAPSDASPAASQPAGASVPGGSAAPSAPVELTPAPAGLLPIVVPPVPPVAPAPPAVPVPSAVAAPPAGTSPSPSPAGTSPLLSPSASASASASGSPSPSASASPAESPPGSPAAVPDTPIRPEPDGAEPLIAPLVRDDAPGSADQVLAAPPAEAPGAASATANGAPARGWRKGAIGILMILVGLGLVTRRVFGRGSGTRRR
ncbi:Ig-like domain-containing protein [Kitasatospora sp. NPDC094015]|uniref:Ig-like domain-containing protein n=1 Tax=Kitasatospora sp. NPDC094015 TaxID=3155205 RepID=UPI0033226830